MKFIGSFRQQRIQHFSLNLRIWWFKAFYLMNVSLFNVIAQTFSFLGVNECSCKQIQLVNFELNSWNNVWYEDEWKLVFRTKHNSLHAVQIMNNDTLFLIVVVEDSMIQNHPEAGFYSSSPDCAQITCLLVVSAMSSLRNWREQIADEIIKLSKKKNKTLMKFTSGFHDPLLHMMIIMNNSKWNI